MSTLTAWAQSQPLLAGAARDQSAFDRMHAADGGGR